MISSTCEIGGPDEPAKAKLWRSSQTCRFLNDCINLPNGDQDDQDANPLVSCKNWRGNEGCRAPGWLV